MGYLVFLKKTYSDAGGESNGIFVLDIFRFSTGTRLDVESFDCTDVDEYVE